MSVNIKRKSGKNKAAIIRGMLQDGKLTPTQIAKRVGCNRNYVHVVRTRHDGNQSAKVWRDQNPTYHRDYMRDRRARIRADQEAAQ